MFRLLCKHISGCLIIPMFFDNNGSGVGCAEVRLCHTVLLLNSLPSVTGVHLMAGLWQWESNAVIPVRQ